MSQPPSRSQQLYARACRVLPGGVSRNTVLWQPHPIYAAHAEGCRVTDLEGVTRLDFANNVASLIHGHAHPAIVEAVTQQVRRGTAFSLATEAEVLLAEHLCARAPGFEKIRFVNSGTEAVMCCLKAARAFTGRPKIAKVEGSYHGLYDYAEVSQASQPANWGAPTHPRRVPLCHGTPAGVLNDVLVIPFNQPEISRAILDQYADEVAAVLVDPLPHRVGLIPASTEFIRALRDWTTRHGALLVFDEVITFRSEYAGAQQWYDVRPDLTALGKMIGGGFPVGAFAGRADVMEVLNPLKPPVRFPHAGTFSANPITMTAGRVALERFDPPAVARLNQLGERARRQIAEAIRHAGVPASVTGAGSMFRLHFKPQPPRDHRSGYVTPTEARVRTALLDYALAHGIILINSGAGALSTPMTEREIDTLAEVLLDGFRHLHTHCPELRDLERGAGATSS